MRLGAASAVMGRDRRLSRGRSWMRLRLAGEVHRLSRNNLQTARYCQWERDEVSDVG